MSSSVPRSMSPMKTWPEVSVSRPATQCISVDLPDPDGPMIAVNWPAAKSTRHAVERAHLGVARAVDLRRRRRRGPATVRGLAELGVRLAEGRHGGTVRLLRAVERSRDRQTVSVGARGRESPRRSGGRHRMLRDMTCPSCGAVAAAGARFCSYVRASALRRGRRAAGRHGPVRRPRRLHDAVRDARPRAGEEPRRRLLRAPGGRHRPRSAAGSTRSSATRSSPCSARPIAHEDDAERAVRAALRMQQTIAELRPPRHRDVGVAHAHRREHRRGARRRAAGRWRLHRDGRRREHRQPAADRRRSPGEVLVGPATYAATQRRRRATTALGPVQAKGREEPVEAWVAVEPIAAPGPPAAAAPHAARRARAPSSGCSPAASTTRASRTVAPSCSC